jgi:hypothetical protein
MTTVLGRASRREACARPRGGLHRTARDVREHRAALRFHEPLPAGAYTLVVTATERDGDRLVRRRRVTLR